ncbi:MAG TPA: cytochrome b/b6 domain-containing protein [Coriobacteriia bacterium]|nr:cytochrome b/b6 domain-containing protein [Coriobacteriia bacterium]
MEHPVATVEEHPATPRVLHIIHLVSMFVLIITGFYISDPFFPGGMGIMRGGHLFFMWVLIITAIVRVIWAFVGRTAPLGSHETIRDYKFFGPQKENRGTLGGTIAYYTFMRKEAPTVYKYNGLQKGTYIFWLLLIVAQAITGFALWTPFQLALEPLTYAVGGPIYMRTIHYIIMWLFIITTAIHIYLSTLHMDQFSVMFTGREPGDAPTGTSTRPVTRSGETTGAVRNT